MLRKAIKDEKKSFDSIDADRLDLWNVSIEIDDDLSEKLAERPHERTLRPTEILSDVFPNGTPAVNTLHIVVYAPPGTCFAPVFMMAGIHSTLVQRLNRVPPSAYNAPAGTATVEGLRSTFLNNSPHKSPSAGGQTADFSSRQHRDAQAIACNRPSSASDVIPVTLLHPVFGEFIDDCDNYEPNKKDHDVVLKLQTAMSHIYADEKSRAKAIRDVFESYGIYLRPTKIGSFETDGDMTSGRFVTLLAEFKNDVGWSGAEPYLQAALYYLEFTRKLAPKYSQSSLPCLIMLVFGSFSSAVLDSLFTKLELYARPLPMFRWCSLEQSP
jgi:hypothetical protein